MKGRRPAGQHTASARTDQGTLLSFCFYHSSSLLCAPTEEEKLPAVPVQLSQVNAELVDGRAVPVLVEQRGKLLNLLR